jgi:hypothetical protein
MAKQNLKNQPFLVLEMPYNMRMNFLVKQIFEQASKQTSVSTQ